MAEELQGLLPMNAMMGWTEGVESRNDAIELAKGFISRRYTAVEASWYAVAPFMGGYLWEVHEGGPGKGYIGAAIEALSQNPGSKFWFPSSDRAFQVMMRDGKPFGILLSKSESLPVINSGQPPLAMVTKMQPAVRKGTTALVTGATMLGAGAVFLVSAMGFYAVSANPGPSVRAVNFSAMPHAQWSQVSGTGVEEIVSKIEMKDGKWTVEKRPHVVPGLRELRDEGAKAIQKARDSIMPMPVMEEDRPATGAPSSAPPAAPSSIPPTAPGLPQAAPQPTVPAAPAIGPAQPPRAAVQPATAGHANGRMSPADMRRAMRERENAGMSPTPPKALPAPMPIPVDKGAKQ